MKMKLGVIVLSASALMSTTVFGMDFNPSVYVGAEAQMNKLKSGNSVQQFQDSKGNSLLRQTNIPGAGLQLGTRLNENAGLEVGYSWLRKSNSIVSDVAANVMTNKNLLLKMKNTYVDLLGYVPVANDINLIGSLGFGRLSTKAQVKTNGVNVPLTQAAQDATKTKMGVRFGVGAEYKIDSNISARFMLRQQKGNGTVKNVKSAGLGLFYQF